MKSLESSTSLMLTRFTILLAGPTTSESKPVGVLSRDWKVNALHGCRYLEHHVSFMYMYALRYRDHDISLPVNEYHSSVLLLPCMEGVTTPSQVQIHERWQCPCEARCFTSMLIINLLGILVTTSSTHSVYIRCQVVQVMKSGTSKDWKEPRCTRHAIYLWNSEVSTYLFIN